MNQESATPAIGLPVPNSKPLPMYPDAKREQMLSKIALKMIGDGRNNATTIHICKLLSAKNFVTPFVPADVERKVLAIIRQAQRSAELAETDLDKVITAMNQKLVWLTNPKAIYDIESGKTIKKEALKAHFANTCVILSTGGKDKCVTHFDAWMLSPKRREHLDLDFIPGGVPIVNDRINLWKEWAVKPVAGDIAPWIELLDLLFGAETPERDWVEKWFAYPIQHPGAKLHTAIVIWSSRQGVGKTLLATTVGKLYGNHFTKITSKMLRSKYNGWAQESLLILGEEKNSDQKADADMLKDLITGETVEIEKKYWNSFTSKNQMNIIFTSNHSDALHLEPNDRRYFVYSVTAEASEAAFYDTYSAWASSDGGQSALMHHMLHLDLTGFDPNGHAPMTPAKQAMIEQSKTDLEVWLTDALTDEYIDGHIRREIVTLAELVRLYQQDIGATRTTPKAMGNALRSQCAYQQNRVSSRGKRPPVVTLRRHDYWATQDNTAWSAEYNKASPIIL